MSDLTDDDLKCWLMEELAPPLVDALRELQRRRAEHAALEARVVDVANEQFGPFPVQTADEALTAIERGHFALRQKIERSRAEHTAGREHVERVVREAIRNPASSEIIDFVAAVARRVADRLCGPAPTAPSTPGPGVMDVHAVTNQLSPASKEQPRGIAYIDRLRAREQAAALAKVLGAEERKLLEDHVIAVENSIGWGWGVDGEENPTLALLRRLIAGARP